MPPDEQPGTDFLHWQGAAWFNKSGPHPGKSYEYMSAMNQVVWTNLKQCAAEAARG